MNKLVLFEDDLEDTPTPQFGILLEDKTILCLCCLGILENGDYKIIKEYSSVDISEILKEKIAAN